MKLESFTPRRLQIWMLFVPIGFAIVYFIVFAAGFAYLLRLMARAPDIAGSGEPAAPIRTAGIVPGQEGE